MYLADISTNNNAHYLNVLHNGQVFWDDFEYLAFHLDQLTVMFVASGV